MEEKNSFATIDPDLSRLMTICAFRYCLGRMTYIVQECVKFLKSTWPAIQPGDRRLIKMEIREAVELGHAGMDFDVKEWLSILGLPDGDESEPHKVSSPSTPEEIESSDNLVIKTNLKKARTK